MYYSNDLHPLDRIELEALSPLFGPGVDEEVLVEDEVVEKTISGSCYILVYNDDFNTFDWVIESFIEILGHSIEQAEQCALLIHTKGKAIVKRGSRNDLKPMKDALTDRGLSAVLEDDTSED